MNRREFLKFKAEDPDWKAREEAHAEAKERMRAYHQKPEVKERKRAYMRACRSRAREGK